jgi:hypothetical protein
MQAMNDSLSTEGFEIADNIHGHADPLHSYPGPSLGDGDWSQNNDVSTTTVVPDMGGDGKIEIWERDDTGHDHYVIPGTNGAPIICDEEGDDTDSCDPPIESLKTTDPGNPCASWPTVNECEEPQEC